MNIQEYIRSGIIESYVLGLADTGEMQEVERLRRQYPEIEQEIRAFEVQLEANALRKALPVSPDVKANLLQTLNLQKKTIVDIPAGNDHVSKSSVIKYLAAAAVVLLALSIALNFYTYSKYKRLVAANRQLSLERNRLYATTDAMQARLNELDKNMQLITGEDMVKVTLSGVKGKEKNLAIVYWSRDNKTIYLIAKNLPQAPKGKQYQLWALMDGKPIDAGVMSDCASICRLKNIQNAQAFAVTLEKEGGSQAPDLTQLYVMGKI